jgi:hypothetical protein
MCPSEATYLPSDLFQPASTVKIQLNVRGVEAGGKGAKLYLSQQFSINPEEKGHDCSQMTLF